MQFSHASGKRHKIERSTGNAVCGRLVTCSLAAAIGIQPVSFPRSGCRRRRDGRHSLSVLPETGWKLSHSRSRSQAATADCLPSARRRREYRHEGGIPKGRALRRVFCPAFSARAEKGWPSETSPQTLIYAPIPANKKTARRHFVHSLVIAFSVGCAIMSTEEGVP